jgi:hypothetical protein
MMQILEWWSAVKFKARGYRTMEYMATMLYVLALKLILLSN